MDPTQAFCPNRDCPARGQLGKGNLSVHSRKERRFICRQCGKTFAERTGTSFYRLRTPTETVTLVVTLLAHGCPVQAIVAAFGFDERTVANWLDRAGVHCRAVNCGSRCKVPSPGWPWRSCSPRGCGSEAR
jgi:transposase-like protein